MSVISIHEYELRSDINQREFEHALLAAEREGLLDAPGMIGQHFLRGLKGSRQGRYAAIWVYRDLAAWEAIWGPPDQPTPASKYPRGWQRFEQEFLRPYLVGDPDEIRFTAYLEINEGE